MKVGLGIGRKRVDPGPGFHTLLDFPAVFQN